MPTITAVYWKDGKAEMVAIEDEDLEWIDIEILNPRAVFRIEVEGRNLLIQTRQDDMVIQPRGTCSVRISSL